MENYFPSNIRVLDNYCDTANVMSQYFRTRRPAGRSIHHREEVLDRFLKEQKYTAILDCSKSTSNVLARTIFFPFNAEKEISRKKTPYKLILMWTNFLNQTILTEIFEQILAFDLNWLIVEIPPLFASMM